LTCVFHYNSRINLSQIIITYCDGNCLI